MIESQLITQIERVFLPNEVFDFGIDRMSEQTGSETQLQATTLFNLKREIQTLTKQKNQIENNLVIEMDAEIRSIMKRKYEGLKINIQRLDENYNTLQEEIANYHFNIIQALKVIKNAKKVLESGTGEQKKSIFRYLGSNWKIKSKKIDYKPHFVIEAVYKTKEFIRLKKGLSEPTTALFTKGKTLSSKEISFVWYTLWEFIRNSN